MSRNDDQAVKEAYVEHVFNEAKRVALEKDRALVPNTQHLAIAILNQVAEAFVSNQKLAAALNDLKADHEALKRAIANDSKLKSVPN